VTATDAVNPLDYHGALGVPTRTERWRRENPDALRTWTTKHGCVVQFWGMRIYYGRCRDCGSLVTTRRGITGLLHRDGMTFTGSWPQLCGRCRTRKDDEHAANARYRMARLRRQRYASRDEQYGKIGLPPVRQGVPGWQAKWDRSEREFDEWRLMHDCEDGDGCCDPPD
jgi:hypothetical protein